MDIVASSTSSSKPRVLLLLHSLSLTGAPKIAVEAFEQIKDEFTVQVLALADGPLQERCRNVGPLSIIPELSGTGGSIFQRVLQRARGYIKRKAWIRSLKRFNPDLIYVNSVAALPIARRLPLPSAPVLLHVHEIDSILYPYSREFPDLLFEWPFRYIACSEVTRQTLAHKYGIQESDISLVYEFVQESDFSSLSMVNQTPEDKGECLVVGGAGQLNWCKGSSLWLEMAAELLKLMGKDRVRFVWVGVADDVLGWQFREMARKLKIEPYIKFVPITPEPLPHFTEFDVFAMTSWEESASIVSLENMMLQKPVFCFAGSGGPPELVGETGVVIEEFSPSAMAAAIAEMARMPEKRFALGEAARERVLARFTDSVQVPRIRQEIKRVIDTHRQT